MGFICTECHKETDDDARFCKNCGARISRDCGRCGGKNTPDSDFCIHCGIKLADATLGLAWKDAAAWADYFATWCPIWPPSLPSSELLATLSPKLDLSSEKVVFAAPIDYQGRSPMLYATCITNRDTAAALGEVVHKGTLLATNWRFIVVDDDHSRACSFSYETVEKCELREHRPWDTQTTVYTNSGHSIDFFLKAKGTRGLRHLLEILLLGFSRGLNPGKGDVEATVQNLQLQSWIAGKNQAATQFVTCLFTFFQKIAQMRQSRAGSLEQS